MVIYILLNISIYRNLSIYNYCDVIMFKKSACVIILVMLFAPSIVMAEANDSGLFDPGNARTFYDAQNTKFKNLTVEIIGAFMFLVGVVVLFSGGGATATSAASKSGFSNPEKSAHSGGSVVAIVFIALGFVLFLTFASGIFGF
jgi:hypothetical protein